MNTAPSVVIIGTGLAGYNLAKEFRKLNTAYELTLITQDDGHFYSKPQLSTAVQQQKTPEQLVITPCQTMKTQLNATIYTHTKVLSIDPETQTMILENGSRFTLPYDTLILAVGAAPRPFPLLQDFKKHFRVNTLQDYAHFMEKKGHATHATVIGSGLVGCEFAHDLIGHMPHIEVITPDPYPLYNLVPSCIGQSLQATLAEKGVTWFTQTSLTQATCQEDTVTLHTAQGPLLTTDCVLTAIGITPALTLAQQAGLVTRQGIVVDEYLQTSHANIYALGDCAEIKGTCYQYVAPLLQSARALAQTLAGTLTPITFSTDPIFPISLKVNSYPVVTLPPHRNTEGEWDIQSDGPHHKALFWDKDERLAGYALGGQCVAERQLYLNALQQRSPKPINSE